MSKKNVNQSKDKNKGPAEKGAQVDTNMILKIRELTQIAT